MKRILFDIRTAQTYYGRGVFRYCFDLACHLAKYQSPDFQIYLLADKSVSELDRTTCQTVHLPVIDISNFDSDTHNLSFDIWLIGTFIYFHAPKKWGFITYTYPKNIILKCPKIIGIIHDMIPLYYPDECLNTFEKKINYALQFESLKLADHYFCNSLYTLHTAQKLLHRPLSDFSCIYGSTDLTKWHNPQSDRVYTSSTRQNHIVYVGGNVLRKNYMGLIKAFHHALQSHHIPTDAKLYLVCNGELSNATEYIQVHHLENSILMTGFISDKAMLNLIANAKATFFPSFYEGLGLPILESYAAGTPCFVANTTATQEFSLPETQFNPYQISEIEKSIMHAFHDEAICRQNLQFGRNLLKKLTWDTIAQKVIAIVENH